MDFYSLFRQGTIWEYQHVLLVPYSLHTRGGSTPTYVIQIQMLRQQLINPCILFTTQHMDEINTETI